MIKLFIVSDIHAHCRVLKRALKDAGFDASKEDHHLLVLGDLFDRGNESFEVFDYIYTMYQAKKATVILGNHDYFLLEFFEAQDDRTVFNIKHNGFAKILSSFSGIPVDLASDFNKVRMAIRKRVKALEPFLKALPLFIETSDYIFTHGGVDGNNPAWKETDKKTFVWQYQYDLEGIEGKTIIVGHMRTAHIRLKENPTLKLDPTNETLFQPIERPGKVFIDGFVEFSNHINVYNVLIDAKEKNSFNI